METRKVQCLLYVLDYPVGELDGVPGPKTRAAITAFQRDAGLPETGEADSATEAALRKAAAQGSFWDSVRWFDREEFRCKCGGRFCSGYPAEMSARAVRIADAAREHFGRPAYVVSGLRCREWNARCGGVANSRHMTGEAIDLAVEGVDAQTLLAFVSAREHHRYSYAITDTNVHFDVYGG